MSDVGAREPGWKGAHHSCGAPPAHRSSVKITYIGHATLLLDIAGMKILTDPNFESSLGRLLPRVSAPGVALDKLPVLDALLLTHAHADHLSFRTLDRLPRNIPLYAPGPVVKWLVQKGYGHATPLDPGESVQMGKVRIHAGKSVHQGNRYGFDRWRNATNMYVIESPDESIFFAGDTALTESTHHLVERVLWNGGRELDVALLPIGWAPSWKPGFRRGHLTSDDALELFRTLRARALFPYHWGTFRHVTASAYDAINRLRARLEGFAGREHVHIVEPGESLLVDDAGLCRIEARRPL
ncbi:MAG: beta-lactamase domain protein [Gemmatimonadetes bacterium]|nr:beta-lactamase domain protein [Gemmatimonadota bacterium]